ncbi:Cof-type HAD-IIB family hydrolase [Bacillus dakarensis]|uniref:Cof-type HAD-IIB family hydrolase n=1 Tax=Robertmurraya dakarensis TaxID=1926278 RepID=UPI000980980F|nr:Cof-type HAD-IIB family hydrolase [Bacillus dakarensis]
MIKCIAIDMDGTLLRRTNEISDENREAIKKAQEQGVEVVIATGRSFAEAIYLLEDAGVKCPVICVNGAEIRSIHQEIIKVNPLDKEKAQAVYEVLHELDFYTEFFTNKGTFTEDIERGVSIFQDVLKTLDSPAEREKIKALLDERLQFIVEIDSLSFIFEKKEYHFYKLLAFSRDFQKLEGARKRLKEIEGIAVSSSGKENIEVNGMNAQKGLALEAFVKEKGISLMETMAIGDSYNDLSMFQRVGRSVAMGNADDRIKSSCDFVTLTNDENGVAKAIMDAIQ